MSSSQVSRVRFLRLDRLFREHRDQYLEAIEKTLESGQVVGGAEVERFEARIAEKTGRKHAVAVRSGTDAMMVLLSALGVARDWSFKVPAYTFVATASPLVHLGVRPRFVDVDDFYHLDLDAQRGLPDEAFRRGMIAVGLFGHSVDFSRFEEFCRNAGIELIEDAAQSFGAFSEGRPGGSLGSAATLSFAPTKPLPCFGNFGAIVTNDERLAERARSIRYHGRSPIEGRFSLLGYNSLPSTVAAATLNVSLDHFESAQRRRDGIAAAYYKAFEGMEDVGLPRVRSGTIPNWHKFVVRHPDRDALRIHFSECGIETQVHYARILPDSPIFSGESESDFPNARKLARESLTLPLHAEMTEGEVEQVVEAMLGFGVD